MKEKKCDICKGPIVDSKPANICNEKTDNKHMQVCQLCYMRNKMTRTRFRTYRSPWWKEMEKHGQKTRGVL